MQIKDIDSAIKALQLQRAVQECKEREAPAKPAEIKHLDYGYFTADNEKSISSFRIFLRRPEGDVGAYEAGCLGRLKLVCRDANRLQRGVTSDPAYTILGNLGDLPNE